MHSSHAQLLGSGHIRHTVRRKEVLQGHSRSWSQRLAKTQARSQFCERMPRHWNHIRVATMMVQETRARERACQLETFVMINTCFTVGTGTRLSSRRAWEKESCTHRSKRRSRSQGGNIRCENWRSVSSPWTCQWAPMQQLESSTSSRLERVSRVICDSRQQCNESKSPSRRCSGKRT